MRVLADRKYKFTILPAKPAVEARPTVAELNGGIEACMKVLADGFRFTPTDSATQSGKALCGANAQVFTDSNFILAFTIWRYYLAAGGVDPAEDELFDAVKTRGALLWAYARISDKPATEPWAADDEIRIGARFTVDHLQDPDTMGWISYVVPTSVEDGWTFQTPAAA